jgi:segregation and condensation protein A
MNAHFQPGFAFEPTAVEDADDALLIDIDGYEGPLHALLALARSQKVDLLRLSVAKLADQFLAFVKACGRRQFALAADYLVMAAWLAFLKSRLLLPKADRPPEEATAPEAAAAQLAFRLAKLDAMRRAAESLANRPILRRDVFTRGDPQAVSVVSHRRLEGDLLQLVAAYLQPRARDAGRVYRPRTRDYYRLDDARSRLRAVLPDLTDWTPLGRVAPDGRGDGPSRASCLASTLSASLELVREGDLEARQLAPYAEIYLRAADPP